MEDEKSLKLFLNAFHEICASIKIFVQGLMQQCFSLQCNFEKEYIIMMIAECVLSALRCSTY